MNQSRPNSNYTSFIVNNFDELFNEFYERLSRYANTIVKDMETAREIVQGIFVKIYEQKNTIQINTSIKSYLYKSVHNSCLNFLKQNQIKNKHHAIMQKNMDSFSNETSDAIMRNELEHKLYLAIEELPKKCKRIFKLNRFEGKTNQEIANELGLSKRTVETQISIALKNLRKKMEAYLN